jgi:hypothetical protein
MGARSRSTHHHFEEGGAPTIVDATALGSNAPDILSIVVAEAVDGTAGGAVCEAIDKVGVADISVSF